MKLIKQIISVVILLSFAQMAFSYQFVSLYDDSGRRDSLSASGTQYYEYYVSSDKMAVLTLKNLSYSSDFDIYVYSNSSLSSLIGKGTNGSTTTEIELIDQKSYGRTVYIKVENCGNSYASFKLYAHEIDFIEILKDSLIETAAISILKAIFSNDDDTAEDSRNKGRAATAIIGAISGKNFGEIGADLLISEVTTKIQEELGYGFWGDYAVSCATNFIRKIYKYY